MTIRTEAERIIKNHYRGRFGRLVEIKNTREYVVKDRFDQPTLVEIKKENMRVIRYL